MKSPEVAEAPSYSEFVRATRVKVAFLDTTKAPAAAHMEMAAWRCKCGDPAPLLGRCDNRITVCHSCSRKYRVVATQNSKDGESKARAIEEVA
jgi:hypothetical protein